MAGLKAIAGAFVDLVYADEALQLYRLIIAEQQHFPELGELVYRSGPESVLQQLSSYLAELHARGILSIDDIETSSRLFSGYAERRSTFPLPAGFAIRPERSGKTAVDRRRSFFISQGAWL